ncbi:thioredoxin family protein [Aquimarina muelleri]|nr:thioredoxin family protein [Aquimarina muelleri]MCX2764395.1 thioredoxin family protein [Aquimarina muelleri]
MKKIVIIVFCAFSISCASTLVTKTGTTKKTNSQSQTSDTVSQKPNPEILVGKQDRKALQQEPFGTWFTKNYKEYTIDETTVKELAPYVKDISIKAFMGTWCSDSKRETPAFYKILDNAWFNYTNLELITVTREKDTPEGFEKGLHIDRVPTFIFYKNGKELGRYVEFAKETLEKDILAIVSGAPYKHSYED